MSKALVEMERRNMLDVIARQEQNLEELRERVSQLECWVRYMREHALIAPPDPIKYGGHKE